MLCDKLYRVRFQYGVRESRFVAQYLSTGMARGQIELAASGASSSMVNIGQATILEMQIGLPELAEQQKIIDYITERVRELDALTAEARRAIDLLQERRTALTSAAVTGQIDVRRAACAIT